MDGQTLCLLALNSFPRNWNVKYLVFKIGRLQNLSFHCIFFKTALSFFLFFIAIESYVVGIPITGNYVKIQCLSKNLKKKSGHMPTPCDKNCYKWIISSLFNSFLLYSYEYSMVQLEKSIISLKNLPIFSIN